MLIRVDDREILIGVSVQNITVLSPWLDNDTPTAKGSGIMPSALEALPETLTP
jgi:flagellar biogenesis protein FliO